MSPVSCWNLLLLLLLSPAAVGASLRSPMRLSGSPAAVAAAAMPQPARPKAGPTKRQQHSSTTKEQLLCGGASLRSPMRLTGCCCGGFCRRCCCHQPGQPTRAGTVDFAAAAAGALEHQPGQPTRAGTVDFVAAAAILLYLTFHFSIIVNSFN